MQPQLSASILRGTILLSLLATTGCGSGAGPTSTTTGPLLPNFESIQANILTPQCTNCHVGATAPLGLRLDATNSYALLVGRASSQSPGLLRVDPGDPDASYLIHKLEGTAPTGGRMPLDAPPLLQSDVDIIRQWILDGAQPGGGPPPAGPVRVTSLDPLPDSVVAMLPMTVTAIFDRELNATTVDSTTFVLERSGGDGTFGDGNEIAVAPVSVTVPQVNPMTAVFDMSATTPVEDTYRVMLIGTGPATIQDLDGNSLDGEFTGVFPSGNGAAGGNFNAQFIVEGVQPTLQSIQDNVFTPRCAVCHSGPMSSNVADLPSAMDLTSLSMSFTNLVGVDSLQDGDLERVTPGDPDNSYLVRKLEGMQTVGDRMPQGGPFLDQSTIDVIRQWIGDGAQM